jgi:hypothetical protein
MASPLESRPFIRSVRRSEKHRFDIAYVSVPRVLVAVGLTVFLVVSLVLLERRLAGAFVGSLTPFGYAFWMFSAGAICAGLKFTAGVVPPRLSHQASSALGVVMCGLLLLFTWAIFPAYWNWPIPVGTLCWLAATGWFCCSRSAVLRCRIVLENQVWPVLSEFFLRSAIPRPLSEFDKDLDESKMRRHPVVVPGPEVRTLKLAAVPDAEENAAVLKFSDPSRVMEQPAAKVDEPDSGIVTSQQLRRIETNGDDVLEVQSVAFFPAGTRQAVLHIPFSPAFAETPRVECEVADGSEVRLKMGAIFPYGARVELKRGDADLEELGVAVELFAVCSVTRANE